MQTTSIALTDVSELFAHMNVESQAMAIYNVTAFYNLMDQANKKLTKLASKIKDGMSIVDKKPIIDQINQTKQSHQEIIDSHETKKAYETYKDIAPIILDIGSITSLKKITITSTGKRSLYHVRQALRSFSDHEYTPDDFKDLMHQLGKFEISSFEFTVIRCNGETYYTLEKLEQVNSILQQLITQEYIQAMQAMKMPQTMPQVEAAGMSPSFELGNLRNG